MKTSKVAVEQVISVTVDETKFTPQFMEEFRRLFFPFYSIDDHVAHLAQMYARGVADEFTGFIEGYGPPSDFGIKFEHLDGSEEILSV
jgi:hypothetical protein